MAWMHDYYRETISTALDEAPPDGVVLTGKQIDYVVEAVLGAIENQSTFSGEDRIPDPDGPSAVERALREQALRHERELAARDQEIHAYRSSVAARRNVPIEDVQVIDGDVIYGRA